MEKKEYIDKSAEQTGRKTKWVTMNDTGV